MFKTKAIRATIATLALSLLSACTPHQAISATFGRHGAAVESQAHRVVACESQYNVNAVSPTNDHGLFQINKRWHHAAFTRVTGQPWHKVYDPFWNAVYAQHLWASTGGNWQHWTCRP